MSSLPLSDQAAHYVAGSMTPEEREAFEVVLEYHAELRREVAALQYTAARLLLARANDAAPVSPPALRERILTSVAHLPPRPALEALVVTDSRGHIEWVNPAFTAMCGHTLDELRGKKPGPLLQGPATDPAAATRLRAAIHAARPCRETLVNYHKNGTPYRAQIAIMPLLDDDGLPLWFVARERLVA